MDQFPDEILVDILSQAYTRYVPQVCRRWLALADCKIKFDLTKLSILNTPHTLLSPVDFNRIDTCIWLRRHKLQRWFIIKYYDKFNDNKIAKHQKIPSYMIREGSFDWCLSTVIIYQRLSEKLLRFLIKGARFTSKLEFNNISKYQTLSEDFIREFKDKVNWEFIVRYQRLSNSFILEFKDRMLMSHIRSYQRDYILI